MNYLGHPIISAWIQVQIRHARHLAHNSEHTVESTLLRGQWARVNEIRALFPYSSVPSVLKSLMERFDYLPDEGKTVLAEPPAWTAEALAWARARLEQDRHRLCAEGFDFPATALHPQVFTEAAERFPGQDTDGCLFSAAVQLAYEGRENVEHLPLFPAQTVPAHPMHPTGMLVRALYTAALRAQDPEYTARDAVQDIAHDLRISGDMVDPEHVLVERWVLDYGARAADFRDATDAWGRVGVLAASAPEAFRRDTGREPPEDLVTRVERAAHRMLQEPAP
jgi:hypothetical protein